MESASFLIVANGDSTYTPSTVNVPKLFLIQDELSSSQTILPLSPLSTIVKFPLFSIFSPVYLSLFLRHFYYTL